MSINLSITAKLSLLIVGTVLITVLAVNQVYIRGSKQLLIERAIGALESEAEFFEYPLSGRIEQLRDDVQLLANLQATQSLMKLILNTGRGSIPQTQRADIEGRLITIFSEMLRTRENYLHIRYIGVADEGREILRVERRGARVERTLDDKLQQSSDRPYFHDAFEVKPGEVYLSEIRLNHEFGKVVVPHALVLRAALPIFTVEGEPVRHQHS